MKARALLLAAGLGTRLRPLTDEVPKCLVRVAGRPLIDHWFDVLARAGVRDVLVNTHHRAEQVRAHLKRRNDEGKLRIREFHEPELLGSAGTVAANPDWLDGADLGLVIYADNLSNADLSALLRFHGSHGDPLTIMLFKAPNPRAAGIAELDAEGRIVGFEEKPKHPRSDLANAGVYALTRAAWREVAALRAFDFGFDVLPRFLGRMRAWIPDAYHRDIGTTDALARADREARAVFSPGAGR